MSDEEPQITVYCVRQQDGATATAAMLEAFEKVAEVGGESRWFTAEETLQVQEKNRSYIYLFEEFVGPAFQHILSTGNRIYGPICLLNCIKLGEALPKLPVPVYCLAMRGVTVSCTSLGRQARDVIHQQIEWMSGEVSRDFHEKVTHLIAGEVGSKKYLVAAKIKKKIMSPEWVQEVWNSSRSSFVKADDPCFDKCQCPVFKGCVVTVSGIDSSERTEIRELVEREGGKYSGEMKINECTHLVISVPRGQKYEFAKKWKINITSPQWLYDSVEAGYCKEEAGYSVEAAEADSSSSSSSRRGKATSTPTRDADRVRLSGLPDMSAISATHINDTAMSTALQTTVLANQTRLAAATEDPLDRLDVTAANVEMFLDGCKIFLSGFKGAALEKLRKIINIGGGTRFNQINDSVSHVVMGERVPEHISQLEAAQFRPHIVSVDWVVECFQQGHCVPETPYHCLQLPPLDVNSPANKSKVKKTAATSRRESTSETNKTARNKQQQQQQQPPMQEDEDDMQQLMSQYLPQNMSGTMGESTLLRAVEGASQDQTTVAPPAEKTRQEEDMDATQDIPNATVEGGADPLLAGKTFVVVGFEIENETNLCEMIQDFGGQVLQVNKTRQIPDYGVVPLFGCPITVTVNEVVTNAWLQMSMERETLLPVDSEVFFAPLYFPDDVAPLEGCVLSISGYAGTEREVIHHLAITLGASVQEYFVKTPKGNAEFLPSTHLVVNAPVGSKFSAAKKWDLPAVTKHWIIECGKQNKKLPEQKFLVDQTESSKTSPGTNPTNTSLPVTGTSSKISDQSVPTAKAETKSRSSRPSSTEIPMEPGTASKSRSGRPSSTEIPLEPITAAKTKTRSDRPSFTDVIVEPVSAAKTRSERPSSMEIHMESITSAATGSGQPSSTTAPMDAIDEAELADRKADKENNSLTGCQRSGESEVKKRKSDVAASLRNHRVRELIQENRGQSATPAAQTDAPDAMADTVTPSKFLDPSKVYLPALNLEDAIDSLQSPVLPPGSKKHERRTSEPFEEVFAYHLKLGVKNTAVKPDCPSNSQTQRPLLEESRIKKESRGPLRGVVIVVSKKLSSRQSEYNNIAASLGADYRWTYDVSCTHYLFQGRQNDPNKEFRQARDHGKTVVSPHWLLLCEEQNSRVDESLFPHTYNPNKSLSVTPARTMRRSTRQRGATTHPSESEEPPTRRVAQTHAKRTASHHGNQAAKEAMLQSLDTTQSDEDIALACENMEEEKKEAEADALVKGLQNFMAATRTYSKGRKKTRRHGSFDDALADDAPEAKRSRPGSRQSNSRVSVDDEATEGATAAQQTSRTAAKQRRARSHMETQPEPSQMVEVTWDDPEARAQRQRLESDLQKSSESFSPTSHNRSSSDGGLRPRPASSTEEEDQPPHDHLDELMLKEPRKRQSSGAQCRVPTPEAPPLAFPLPKTPGKISPPKPVELINDEGNAEDTEAPEAEETEQRTRPVFLLSGMAQQERHDYGALVEDLGGVLCDAQHYDSACTHLVVGNPTRNEKYLSCVAAGKWVLHKSYFEACRQEQTFVQEDDHEWGSTAMERLLSAYPPTVTKLAHAAHHWRHNVATSKQADPDFCGAFGGWKTILLTDKKKEDSFRRLLEAGGATVVATRPPFSNLDEITHAFIDLSKLQVPIDLDVLVHAGIHCVKPEYIASFLMEQPSPQPHTYYIAEVQSIVSTEDRIKKRKASLPLASTSSTPSKRSRHK